MPRVSIAEVQAWLEPTKATLDVLDTDWLPQLETQVLARIAAAYDVSTWVSVGSTPQVVRSVIAMKYAAWFYRRQYSEEGGDNQYADLLDAAAEALILGIINGTTTIVEVPVDTATAGEPLFYPTDASSAVEPTADDLSLGSAKFSLGTIW